ncbi:DedA family protein [Nocardioides bruguierae]|uniref:DedA family protein n=1 Tax=Nocardioides bruguierae TaxID=2945102 RepID=UPI002021EEF8|nr:VTT domain-containing protein [Nocardioides bruguierae]MCL8024479.1 VTT domain-containing protein [Nocardioides bruguierae]
MAYLDPLLASLGLWAPVLVGAVLFAETGLLVGFFLPGDSLLFAVAVLASSGVLSASIWVFAGAAWLGAALGDQVGYLIGQRWGSRLLVSREDGGHRPRWLSGHHIDAAHRFFLEHGHKAVVLARFVPLVRTFTPVVAGALAMPRRRFTVYNVLGGLLWVVLLLAAGWYLGEVRFVADHVDLVTLGLVAVSLVPAGVALLRRRAA